MSAYGPWKTREAVELATLEWVSWFNHHRLLEPIGYIPPAEAEANFWRQEAPGFEGKPITSDHHITGGLTMSTLTDRGPPAAPAGGQKDRESQHTNSQLDYQASPV